MAKLNMELKVVEYKIVFFPVATYRKIGDAEVLTVLGMKIWQKVGDARRLFWITLTA